VPKRLKQRLAALHARHAQRLAARGRWPAAARAYERAIAYHPTNRHWHLALAKAHMRAQQWEAAARAYEGAIALDGRYARHHAKLGRARARAQQWEAAIEAYEAAIARNPLRPQWHAAIARAREHLGHWEGAPAHTPSEARAQARAARERKRARHAAKLAGDPNATDLDRRLAAASPARFAVRRGIGRFVAERLDDIRARALDRPGEAPDLPFKVFVFWAQGIDAAPPIVRRCAAEVRRRHREGDVVFLDAASAREHAEVPADLAGRLGHEWTRLSDLLRLELLSTYGGVWMDATCLPRARMQDVVPDLLESGFFAFTYRHARLGNWFLASEPNHYLVAMLREAHYAYWRVYDHVVDYYLFHHLFEMLYHLDERFAAVWDATPRLPVRRATAYSKTLLEPDDPDRTRALLDSSFVHKLTYKLDDEGVRPGSGLARLLDGELPEPEHVDRGARG
jgi:Capsular polysaccharide synthesis protein/Tetratricopeptide repeat